LTPKVSVRKKEEFIRRQGYKRGISSARTMLVEARNYQVRMKKTNNAKLNPDLEDQFEHTASVLHDLALRLADLIKGVK
jgi:hypothetical protein